MGSFSPFLVIRASRTLVSAGWAIYTDADVLVSAGMVMAKTTFEISDQLLRDAERLAVREGTTLSALVEQGLRKVLTDRTSRNQPFRLRKASVRGQGLNPDVAEVGWDRICDLSYEGRDG